MEAIPLWDRAFSNRMDHTERRRLVADSAISAYKTVAMCTVMSGYDFVLGDALEGGSRVKTSKNK